MCIRDRGHNEKLKVTYNHHEQACAIAAEAYARIDNRIAAVCVTTGPGGTNALTGVAVSYTHLIINTFATFLLIFFISHNCAYRIV